MGIMIHHVIIVTSWNEEKIQLAYAKANTIFPNVLLSDRYTNNYSTLFIPPDGSKEGWATSNAGDTQRETFITWLKTQKHLEWIEVEFGEITPKVTQFR